jgi:hypothetical protein
MEEREGGLKHRFQQSIWPPKLSKLFWNDPTSPLIVTNCQYRQLSSSSKSAIPPTYLEQKRKEAQFQYKEEQAYIKLHKAELERLLDQEQQAMANQVPGSLWEAIDHLKGKQKEEESAAAGSTSPPQPKAV